MTLPLQTLAQRRAERDPRNDPKFMHMMQFVMGQEGSLSGPNSLNANLAEGAGLTQAALSQYLKQNPNDQEAQQWQVGKTLPSPNLALRIYHSIYKNSGADTLPPALGLVHFDAAVNQGPGAAKHMLAQSDSDPTKYIQLRAARYAQSSLNPMEPGWLGKRIPALQQAVQQLQSQTNVPAPVQPDAASMRGIP